MNRIKVSDLNKGNSTKTFDRSISHYWEALDTHSFVKKCDKLAEFNLPFWKKFATRYHFLVNWDLVLAGNSNVVEITKEGLPYSNHLPLIHDKLITIAIVLVHERQPIFHKNGIIYHEILKIV